jgi:prepilin-type N-terminal cleavage/methylation domain-containing protein
MNKKTGMFSKIEANHGEYKNFGFTLAEVLITLGIIGVVAAMTMPTLIQNQQKRSLEVATQKFYSTLSQAVKKYMADEGVDDLRNTPLSANYYGHEYYESPEAIASLKDFVTKYLKVVEECDYDANNCFAPNYKIWDGGEPDGNFITYVSADQRDYVLADGSVIRIGYWDEDAPIIVYVDVNGKKGPNRVGYDLWNMDIFYDGSIDESGINPECKKGIPATSKYHYLCGSSGSNPKETRQHRYEGCKQGNYGGCFGHFLENNFKFDY